jgi:[ribosomal protein S5]-alanine N-acetyltransferase
MYPNIAPAVRWPASDRITPEPRVCLSQYPILATERLRLRGLQASDCLGLPELADDCGDADAAIGLRRYMSRESTQRWIASHAPMWSTLQAAHWAITSLEDDRLMGYISLSEIDLDNRQATLGFRVGNIRQRYSVAAEAAQAALAFAFTDLGMHRVSAFHRVRHPRAAQILTSLCMRSEGLLRQSLRDSDQFEDLMAWALLRSEWAASMLRGDGPLQQPVAEHPAAATRPDRPRSQC